VARTLLATFLVLAAPAPGSVAADQISARTLCTIRDSRIAESSGLAAAGDSLYTVNDGGTRLRVFVLDRACRVRRTVEAALDPYDVEDLARTADGTLWLADTGDNALTRSTVALERLRPDGTATLFRLTYPDGPHDAEALLLDRSGRPFIVTKEPLSSGVYTPDGPLSARRPTTLRRVRTLSFGPTGTTGGPVGVASQVLVTGGAVSADGRLLVLRTYTDAYVWPAPDGDLEAALRTGDSRRIPLPATRQGEGIAVSPDGRALLTSTEGLPGRVHEVPLGDAVVVDSPTGGSDGSADSSTAAEDRFWPDRLRSLAGPALGLAAVAGLLLWLARRTRRPARRSRP
jgi:sugar lactone lactonase YvrE